MNSVTIWRIKEREIALFYLFQPYHSTARKVNMVAKDEMKIKTINSQNASAKKHLSQVLLSKNQDFNRVFSNFPDLVHSVDEAGRVIYANPMVTQLLGYELDEYLGMPIIDIYDSSDHADVTAGFKSLIAKGELDTIETCLISKKGKKIPVEIRSLAIYGQRGSFSRSFSIIRDMRPLLRLKEQMRSASRKSARGEVAEYVAHDLRSPLTTLKLQAESMRTLTKNLTQTSEEVERISSVTAAAVNQIEELLTLLDRSNHASITSEPCDVAKALHRAVNRVYGASLASNISLETDIDDNKYTMLVGDDLRLRQLFGNLLNNAVAAVKKRYEGENGGLIKVTLTANDSGVSVDIDDNGVGIDDDIATKIFTRGFSTRLDPNGTGLGLSICKKILDEHRGQVSLLKTKNTVFHVFLPHTPSKT